LRFLFLLAEHAGEHVLEIDVHLLDALIGDDFERGHSALADLDVDHALVELAFAELGAELLAGTLSLLALLRGICFRCAGSGRRRGRQEEIEHALFRGLFGTVSNFVEFFFANHVDGGLYEIADHGLDVAADVADLGVLGGFDFDKRTTSKTRKTPGDFGFADAGRANHQDVLG
jgi:hypothetical protein